MVKQQQLKYPPNQEVRAPAGASAAEKQRYRQHNYVVRQKLAKAAAAKATPLVPRKRQPIRSKTKTPATKPQAESKIAKAPARPKNASKIEQEPRDPPELPAQNDIGEHSPWAQPEGPPEGDETSKEVMPSMTQ